MSTFLFSSSTNKFRSKLIDRKYKNKHRNGQYREIKSSNKCIDNQYNKIINCIDDIQYENDCEYTEEYDTSSIPIWQCPLCTYINIERQSFCSMCTQPLNYNFYNTTIQSNQTDSISIKSFNNKKIKRKSKKSRKRNKNSFKNYWNSVSKYKNEYDKVAQQNRNKFKQKQIKLKQKQICNTQVFANTIAEPESTNNSKKSKYKRNIKLNVTLRFKTARDCSDHILAVKRYNKKHPKKQINIKDYALLDCCVTIQNMTNNSIIKSTILKPDLKDFYFPMVSTSSNMLWKDDLPLINQTQLFLRGLDNEHTSFHRANRIPIVQYGKMNHSEMRLIASECINDSIENIRFGELKVNGNGSPVLFNKFQLLKLLFEYIPQMDVLANVLLPLVGYTFFYYIRMESDARLGGNQFYQLYNESLDSKKLRLEQLIRKQIQFAAPFKGPQYHKTSWSRFSRSGEYLTYPQEWRSEGHRTRGYGKNKWAGVYVKGKDMEKEDDSNVGYHCPFCRWFEKNKIESNRWGYYYGRWYPRRGWRDYRQDNIPLYKCNRKTKSRKYWRNWY